MDSKEFQGWRLALYIAILEARDKEAVEFFRLWLSEVEAAEKRGECKIEAAPNVEAT